jgi:ActR/RegA family two-component response regulator
MTIMGLLIIEDDLPFIELLERALAPRKLRVAHSMKEALAMIEAQAPEVLILDLALPDSSATETLARIHELKSKSKDATVIVITGRPYSDKDALAYGADKVLSKDAVGFFGTLPATLVALGKPKPVASQTTVDKIEQAVKKIVSP